MDGITQILFGLFLIFLSAKITGAIFEQLHQPAVIGEILAGIIIGPYLLNLIEPAQIYDVLAEIGAIILLFTVGLQTGIDEILKVGKRALLVATLGVIFPFVFGYLYTLIVDHSTIEAMFIGAAMVATSVGITARVLADLKVIDTEIARVILAAAVIDDILGMIVLAVVTGAGQGTISYVKIGIVLLEVVGFVLFLIFIGQKITRKYIVPSVANLRVRNAVFALAIVFCLGLSALASYIEIAAIIGAFMAGMVLCEFNAKFQLTAKTESLYDFLVLFFFVMLGTKVDLTVFTQSDIWLAALLITVFAVLGKLIGCGLAALKMGFKSAVTIGVGMIPRGEVGMIIAAVGLSSQAIDSKLYAVVIFMVIVTTVMTPPILKKLLSKKTEESNPVVS